MNILVNGKEVTLPTTIQTVQQLIEFYEFKSPVIIVEHNDTVLQKDAHEQTTIRAGDKVEFVQFVGGG